MVAGRGVIAYGAAHRRFVWSHPHPTYPFAYTVTYATIQPGRMTRFADHRGRLTRTYTSGMVYSALGVLRRDGFAPTRPSNNK